MDSDVIDVGWSRVATCRITPDLDLYSILNAKEPYLLPDEKRGLGVLFDPQVKMWGQYNSEVVSAVICAPKLLLLVIDNAVKSVGDVKRYIVYRDTTTVVDPRYRRVATIHSRRIRRDEFLVVTMLHERMGR